MSVLKCKMCGAPLNIEGNATVAICEYCGTKQTIPKLDDDRRANLYDRASHFRRNNEFDKAAGIYEQILAEDSTDAEAYWSLVLCRYGIEYVEDPDTRKRIPTVNRTQMTSVYADENYKSAIRYADPMQKPVYEAEARTIDEIQKGILKISSQEEPFDIFICYKETDDRGRRTRDSVLANELYYQLKQEGYKVFFSRITLEDKLGSAYEPYIFAALNSAKVMVVLGTKPEYFNAVWVKNEWSRYLALIKAGKKKTLIPAYRDMDPYELPEEFAYLQALDMSKLGFMQDLIRGIRKIINTDRVRESAKQTVALTTQQTYSVSTAPLVRRMLLFLEDGEWESAEEYTERILDQEPENAMAYVGKLMAELHVPKKELLAELKVSFASNKNYQRAMRFADKELKAELQGYLQAISERRKNEQQLAAYKIAIDKRDAARTEQEYLEAAGSFDRLGEYGNAREQAAWCRSQARINRAALEKKVAQEELRRAAALQAQAEENKRLYEKKIEEKEAETELDYEKAKKLAASNVIQDLADAAEIFRRLGSYKDSEELLAACEEGIRARKKKIKRVFWGLVLLIAGIIAGLKFGQPVITRISAYKSAVNLKSEGKIRDAIEAFSSVRGYKDSESQIFLLETELLKQAKAGDTVLFGSYEQDNKDKNGQEAIEWQVLDKDGTKLLLVSKYTLDCLKYNSSYGSVTWETCSLRSWLNGTFRNRAFSTEEQKYVLTATVTADKNPNYNADPGNDTRDRVFLLSITEAEQYFKSDSQRVCSPTAYAASNGVYQNSNGACWWWLRSPGYYGRGSAANVGYDGSVYSYGGVDGGRYAVRPAIWVDPIGNQGKGTDSASLERPDIDADAVSVGDIISFGHYEQDNNTNNGTEEIEWQVLDKDGTKLLLISKYALDCKQYNSSYNSVTWETCSLRMWLNGSFLNDALSTEEQQYVLTTNVTADRNPNYGTDPGKATKDKVFLLSITEAEQYFKSDSQRVCRSTAYAASQGAYQGSNGACWWWLRSPGINSSNAVYVNNGGSVGFSGNYVLSGTFAVRPALWIDLARDQEPTDSSETESLATEIVIDNNK